MITPVMIILPILNPPKPAPKKEDKKKEKPKDLLGRETVWDRKTIWDDVK
jgi:hypothetical protein